MRNRCLYPVLMCLITISVITSAEFEQQREQMLEDVMQMFVDTSAYTNRAELSETIFNALSNVPRHEFVSESLQSYAYLNRPLPIGNQQTISQPYIVALMTELADVDASSKVLEVGTGSGYQAAVLAEIVDRVYSIEIIKPLGLTAKALLKKLDYHNITVKIGDGYHGWPTQAPFDAILVTAAAPEIPQPLIEQLKPGGRLVIPVREQGENQSLKVIIKGETGEIEEQEVLPVAFVPLTGDH